MIISILWLWEWRLWYGVHNYSLMNWWRIWQLLIWNLFFVLRFVVCCLLYWWWASQFEWELNGMKSCLEFNWIELRMFLVVKRKVKIDCETRWTMDERPNCKLLGASELTENERNRNWYSIGMNNGNWKVKIDCERGWTFFESHCAFHEKRTCDERSLSNV